MLRRRSHRSARLPSAPSDVGKHIRHSEQSRNSENEDCDGDERSYRAGSETGTAPPSESSRERAGTDTSGGGAESMAAVVAGVCEDSIGASSFLRETSAVTPSKGAGGVREAPPKVVIWHSVVVPGKGDDKKKRKGGVKTKESGGGAEQANVQRGPKVLGGMQLPRKDQDELVNLLPCSSVTSSEDTSLPEWGKPPTPSRTRIPRAIQAAAAIITGSGIGGTSHPDAASGVSVRTGTDPLKTGGTREGLDGGTNGSVDGGGGQIHREGTVCGHQPHPHLSDPDQNSRDRPSSPHVAKEIGKEEGERAGEDLADVVAAETLMGAETKTETKKETKTESIESKSKGMLLTTDNLNECCSDDDDDDYDPFDGISDMTISPDLRAIDERYKRRHKRLHLLNRRFTVEDKDYRGGNGAMSQRGSVTSDSTGKWNCVAPAACGGVMGWHDRPPSSPIGSSRRNKYLGLGSEDESHEPQNLETMRRRRREVVLDFDPDVETPNEACRRRDERRTKREERMKRDHEKKMRKKAKELGNAQMIGKRGEIPEMTRNNRDQDGAGQITGWGGWDIWVDEDDDSLVEIVGEDWFIQSLCGLCVSLRSQKS